MALSASLTTAQVAELMHLEPHPEGGFYRRSMEAAHSVDTHVSHPDRWSEPSSRLGWTSIHFLLPAGGKSSLHALKSDELWFWHAGAPLHVVELLNSHPWVQVTVLGPNCATGERLSHVVRGGAVFGAYVPASSSCWSLVSCVVVPGFSFHDWSMPTAAELERRFPHAAETVAYLASDATAPLPER